MYYSSKTAESVLAETTRDVEFVFILVDMTNKQSLDVLNSCLEHFKLKFLTNNVAIILTKGKWRHLKREKEKD
jgi:hypothetical protein